MTGRCTGRGHGMTGRVRSVVSVCAVFSLRIGRAARPVTDDRTRPVIQGAYWTLTGRGHCRVRSLRGARPVSSPERIRAHDRRVRSFTGLERPVRHSVTQSEAK
jgi:hypothetical protein